MTRMLLGLLLLVFSLAGCAQSGDDRENTIYLDTKYGRVVIQLRPDLAPNSVERIKQLTRENFYDNVPFHLVIPGRIVETGDGQFGNGTGISKYPNLPAEISNERFDRGVVGMARKEDDYDSANSQFFIVLADTHAMIGLNGKYTVVGKVVSGMHLVDKIKKASPSQGGAASNPDMIVRMQVAADGQ